MNVVTLAGRLAKDPDVRNTNSGKTVLRKLIGKWGLMSVTYQSADPSVLRAAQAIATGAFDDEDKPDYVVDVNASEAEEAPDQEQSQGTIDLNTPFTPEELGDK